MKTIWNSSDYAEIKNRVARVAQDMPPLWGRMSASQMIAHLTDWFRMATGELPCAPKQVPIRFTPLKQLIIYLLPFPRGVPTAPELLARAPGEWHVELASLQSIIDEFVRGGPAHTARTHPAFGHLTGRAWGVLAYRHTDHHLRQFGV